MNELIGIIFEMRLNYGEKISKLEKLNKEETEIFVELNNLESLESDTYYMFNELMRTGVFEFYIFTEPGKKKGKTEKMFGIVDYSTNNVSPSNATITP